MLHALHCLHIVRRIVEGGHVGPASHVTHCMDYIAQVSVVLLHRCITLAKNDQSLLCQGDDTIEPPSMIWNKFGSAVEVTEYAVSAYQHKCRDTSLIWDTIERSEKQALPKFDWKDGDTIESVLRGL